MKFMFGNKVMRSTNFDTYKFIREIETKTIAERIVQDAQKKNTKINIKQLRKNSKKFNNVPVLMNMKVALKVWKEYTELYDAFKKKGGDLMSHDQIEEQIVKQRVQEMRFYNQEDFISTKDYDANHLKFEIFKYLYSANRKSSRMLKFRY